MDDSGQKGFIWMTYAVLILVIAVSTYLHHFQPQVLSVPSNLDVSTWKNPTFEQTAIYDRMTEDERRKARAEGIPDGGSLGAQIATDIFMIIVGLFCYRHSRIHYGFWMASCFLIGSFVFTGLEESVWILFGRFWGGTLNLDPGGVLFGTYWFSKGGLWFVETPLVACLGWYAIAYSCVWVAGKVFPTMGLWPRAAVGGLIAMITDLWADPVATSPELMNWVWAKGDFFLFFGIPFYNFVGWFLLIFLFAVFWESLPLMEMKWGRQKASACFMAVCTGGAFVTALFIYVFWFVLAGGIASLAGMQPYQLPTGW
jgi:hypothetical protein